MPITPRILKALHALEAAVYEELARLVTARAEPEEIDALSGLLRAVKALVPVTAPPDAKANHPPLGSARHPSNEANGPQPRSSAPHEDAAKDTPTEFSSAGDAKDLPVEFSNAGDALVKKGPRKAGAGYYLQRVPWNTVLRLAETIDSKYGPRPFHPAALSREARAPAYQAYAVLNLFAVKGYLGSPRRGSFRKQRDVALAGTLDALRTELPPFKAD